MRHSSFTGIQQRAVQRSSFRAAQKKKKPRKLSQRQQQLSNSPLHKTQQSATTGHGKTLISSWRQDKGLSHKIIFKAFQIFYLIIQIVWKHTRRMQKGARHGTGKDFLNFISLTKKIFFTRNHISQIKDFTVVVTIQMFKKIKHYGYNLSGMYMMTLNGTGAAGKTSLLVINCEKDFNKKRNSSQCKHETRLLLQHTHT